MDWTGLIFGVAVSIISLSVRWRFPAVPKAVATFGIAVGLGVASWAFTAVPAGLAASLIINLGFAVAIADYRLGSAPSGMPSPAVDNAERDHERALAQIAQAIEDADLSMLGMPPPDLLGMSKATLNSAFMTLKKVYNIPTPTVLVATKESVENGVHFLMEVQPYLSGHHIEAAGKAAEDFLKNQRRSSI